MTTELKDPVITPDMLPPLPQPMDPQIPPGAVPVDFRQYHIHFMIPCYGGMISVATTESFLRFAMLAAHIGLPWSLDTMTNESLIPRGRNSLCAKAMGNPAATHFMFIDADIRFQAESIIGMLLAEKEVIGGLYPKKTIPIDYVVNVKQGGGFEGPLFEVDTLGTGFLLFKKSVYEQLIAAHPDTKYKDDVGLGKQYEPNLYAIFDCKIDEHGHYLSEDWLFCRRWQALGGQCWADSRVLLDHLGTYSFKGDLSALERKGIKFLDPNSPEGKAIIEQQLKAKGETK